jgi:hypothetical protein
MIIAIRCKPEANPLDNRKHEPPGDGEIIRVYPGLNTASITIAENYSREMKRH